MKGPEKNGPQLEYFRTLAGERISHTRHACMNSAYGAYKSITNSINNFFSSKLGLTTTCYRKALEELNNRKDYAYIQAPHA